jgi:hypothetical protein
LPQLGGSLERIKKLDFVGIEISFLAFKKFRDVIITAKSSSRRSNFMRSRR